VTDDNGDHLFIPIDAKWLISGTEDDDGHDVESGSFSFDLGLLLRGRKISTA